MVTAYDEGSILGHSAIASAVHGHGARLVGQVGHGGRQMTSFFSESPIWSPSPIPCPVCREMPHEMDYLQMQEIMDGFARSAANLEAAGYDGIELNAAHGYLLQESMSPWSNRRTDEYGGSLENRLRLISGVIDGIGDQVNRRFLLGVRISADELQECRRTIRGGSISCTQNPSVGHEKEMGIGNIRPAAAKKRVLVVGGGPGGMEAARVAALRGHDVTLYEKDAQLGGQVNIAARAPSREEIAGVVRYLSTQVDKLGVAIRLNTEATAEMLLDERPDAVVVATGSIPLVDPLEGADGIGVASVWDVLLERVDVGRKVVVVDGGEGFWQCCSAAEYLVQRGKTVEVISRLHHVGVEIPHESLAGLYQRLARGCVVLSPLTSLKRVEGRSLICAHVFSGEERKIPDVDTVVMAVGNRACDSLYRSLRGRVKEVHAVGDCVAPRKITEAIREGNRVARML